MSNSIVKIPEKILRKRLEPVGEAMIGSVELTKIIKQLREDMVTANGVGLAGNQIGQDLQIFAIDKKLAEENNIPDIYINPEITEYSREEDEMEEGCLSIPEFYVSVKRPKKIKIKAVTENGEKIKFKAKGFLARVLQHETDHLNGLTIKERLKL